VAKKILLAVLGRGSQMAYPGGPWVLTKDFEIWKLTERSSVLTDPDDSNENCVIGGGELNLAAGVVLYKELNPELTVFAYGDNAPHVGEGSDRPSESNVMNDLFTEIVERETGTVPRAQVFVQTPGKVRGKASGTFKEIKNILRLAQQDEFDEVVLVTVLVHVNRALGMAAKHLEDPEFAGLRGKIRFEVTEGVLLRADPQSYAERVWAIFNSRAFIRNLQRETNGLTALRKGVTQTTQPDIVTTGAG